MERKTLSRFGFLAIFLVSINLNLFAQIASGFVGNYENTVILGLTGVNTLTLGNPNNDKYTTETYYRWRIVGHPQDDEGLLDSDVSYNPVLTVKACGEYVIECVRVSRYGYQTEYSIVYVVDNIEIASIQCLRECYLKNGHIDISDFNIVTDPLGYEGSVELMPGNDVATISSGSWGVENKEMVSFRIKDANGDYFIPKRNKCVINVIDDGVTNSAGIDFERGTSFYSSLLKIGNALKGVSDKIESAKIFKGKAERILYFDMHLTGGQSCDCCDGHKAKVGLLSGTLALGGGADFPVPWPLPPNITLHIKGVAEGALKLIEYPTAIDEARPICRKPLNWPIFIGSLKVSAEILTELIPGVPVLNASGGLKGSVSVEVPFHNTEETLIRANMSFFMNVVCITTILQVDVVIVEGKWYPCK